MYRKIRGFSWFPAVTSVARRPRHGRAESGRNVAAGVWRVTRFSVPRAIRSGPTHAVRVVSNRLFSVPETSKNRLLCTGFPSLGPNLVGRSSLPERTRAEYTRIEIICVIGYRPKSAVQSQTGTRKTTFTPTARNRNRRLCVKNIAHAMSTRVVVA